MKKINYIILTSFILLLGTISSAYAQCAYCKDISINDVQPTSAVTLNYPSPETGVEYEVEVELLYSKRFRSDVEGTNFEVELSFDITDGNGQTIGSVASDNSMEINYQSGLPSKERVLRKWTTSISTVEIENITVNGSTGVPDDVELRLCVRRVEELDPFFQSADLNLFFIDYSLENYFLTTSYNPKAISYEFEWVCVDEYATNVLKPSNGLAREAFGLYQGVSAIVDEPYYEFDPILAKSIVYFRVRPILEHKASESFILGNWQYLNEAQTEPTLTISDLEAFELNKNWSYQRTYTEAGAEKTVVTFADALGASRQLKTDLTSDDNILVAETFYDYEGRGTTSPLPFPIRKGNQGNREALSYFAQANVYADGEGFNRLKKHYDTEDGGGALATVSGAAKYFSPQNDLESVSGEATIHRDYIPDAEGYVVSQMQYLRDQTGRVEEAGVVGSVFSLDKTGAASHTVNTYYLEPTQAELTSLFGSNIGDAKRYRKQVTIDANGQTSITYVNLAGQTVASALAGNGPNSLIKLESNEEAAREETVRLNSELDEVASTSVINHVFNNLGIQLVSFEYDFTGVAQTINNICYSCQYELEISVTSPSGELLTLDVITAQGVNQETTIRRTYSPSDIFNCQTVGEDLLAFSALFDEIGNYQITKRLVAEELALEEIVTTLTENPTVAANLSAGNLPTIEEIENDIRDNTDFTTCIVDCDARCEAIALRDLGITEAQINDPLFATAYQNAVASCQATNCETGLDGNNLLASAAALSCEGLLIQMADQFDLKPDPVPTEGSDLYRGIYFGSTPVQSRINETNLLTTMIGIAEIDNLVVTSENDFWNYAEIDALTPGWQTALARQHHPEIGHYEFCLLQTGVTEGTDQIAEPNLQSYAREVAEVTDFNEAVATGFIDPLNVTDNSNYVLNDFTEQSFASYRDYVLTQELGTTSGITSPSNLDPVFTFSVNGTNHLSLQNCNGSALLADAQNRFRNYGANLEIEFEPGASGTPVVHLDPNDLTTVSQPITRFSPWEYYEHQYRIDQEQDPGEVQVPYTSDEQWQRVRSGYLEFRNDYIEQLKSQCIIVPGGTGYLQADYAVVRKEVAQGTYGELVEESEARGTRIQALSAEFSSEFLADAILSQCDAYTNLDEFSLDQTERYLRTSYETAVEGYINDYLSTQDILDNPLGVVLAEDVARNPDLLALQTYITTTLDCQSEVVSIAYEGVYEEVCETFGTPIDNNDLVCSEEYRI